MKVKGKGRTGRERRRERSKGRGREGAEEQGKGRGKAFFNHLPNPHLCTTVIQHWGGYRLENYAVHHRQTHLHIA